MTCSPPSVVVTGANGLVGSRVCAALVERGASVRAVVRRAGSAPRLSRVTEVVGESTDSALGATVFAGVSAVISTVHPMGSDRAAQLRVGLDGTLRLAQASVAAGVKRLVHVSTAAVYDRSPGVGDIDETSSLVGEDGNDYATTKRDIDLALAELDGITRILLRPPAILGPGPTSVYNSLRPAALRDQPSARRAVADQTFAWVHVSDLASLAADLAIGWVPDAAPAANGPVPGACTPLNVAVAGGIVRDYFQAVTRALGVAAMWDDKPAWTGQVLADRARRWGWKPTVGLDRALDELVAGLARA